MWLKVTFDEQEVGTSKGHPFSYLVEVSLSNEKIAPVDDVWKTFRLSPIFPLVINTPVPDITNCTIHFFTFKNAYRILGRLEKVAEEELKTKVYFSNGLCSVILISHNDNDLSDFKKIIDTKEDAAEKWVVINGRVSEFEYLIDKDQKSIPIIIVDYNSLPLTERALIDEFRITIKLLLLKLTTHMPFELPKIQSLINEVNVLITELVYLYSPNGTPPESLKEFTPEDLKGKKINQTILHQNIDRIIQINSALSYVSTQAFSGAIPILERRSLIRRNSLLGVGSAILALNNIARYIENSFSQFRFDQVITEQFINAAPLPGLSGIPKYDSAKWQDHSVNNFHSPLISAQGYLKLPYFSGRLGFRETEYSIAAAIQSISAGAGLEWSLMTITHEMLHGHVRTIINALFFGDEKSNSDKLRTEFYEKFKTVFLHYSKNDKLIDSIRAVIFSYCCSSVVYGSLTIKHEYKGDRYDIPLLSKDDLWGTFAQEYRNINEIFVHILDLNYFYGNRLSLYIPLIWGSWISVPHINGDVRQYILRSLLSISSQKKAPVYERFNWSVEILIELLTKHSTVKLDYPVIHEVLKILNDKEQLKKYYLPAFKSSLIIVDLVSEMFVSNNIRAKLFQDEYVKWDDTDDDDSFESAFKYQLTDGFNDEVIASPLAFLLDKMAKLLDSDDNLQDIERETAFVFLALNSNE